MSAFRTTLNSILDKFSYLNLEDNFNLVLTARKGVKPKVFYDFAHFISMPEKDLAQLLNLSSRTISNYKTLQKNLEPAQGEHLLKLIALFGKGEEIFGNVDEFNYWLHKPFWNAREKPIDWLVTPGGIDLVNNELERLANAYPI